MADLAGAMQSASAVKAVALEEGGLRIANKAEEVSGRWSVFRGNLTPWWFLGTAYSMVFMVRLGFPRMHHDMPALLFHIPVAFLFLLGCAWNLFHTPHQGPRYRLAHVWIGWIAMVCGFGSVISGGIYILDGTSKLPLGTKVLMMTIAMIQVGLQLLGLWYVRGRRWIQMHMSMMTYLFYMSGVLIAINWIPKMATGHLLSGSGQTNWTFVSMVAGIGLSHVAVKYNRRHMQLDHM